MPNRYASEKTVLTYINKLIYAGWLLYIISLVIPWSGRPFGGWLSGWFWQVVYFFPFFRFVTLQEANIEHIGAYALSLSVIIMFVSPLLLILLNRRPRKYYGYVIWIGFVLAVFSLCAVIFGPNAIPSPFWLFMLGYSIYVGSFAVLSIGFGKQTSFLKHTTRLA